MTVCIACCVLSTVMLQSYVCTCTIMYWRFMINYNCGEWYHIHTCYIRAVRFAPGLPNCDAGVVWEGMGRPVMWPAGSGGPRVTGVVTAHKGHGRRNVQVCAAKMSREARKAPFRLAFVDRHLLWLNEKCGVVANAMLLGWPRGLGLALQIKRVYDSLYETCLQWWVYMYLLHLVANEVCHQSHTCTRTLHAHCTCSQARLWYTVMLIQLRRIIAYT